MMIQDTLTARSLIKPEERTLVVYTKGAVQVFNPDGTGFSAAWRFDPTYEPSRLIIYYRQAGHTQVFTADVDVPAITKVSAPGTPRRYSIPFKNCEDKGTTPLNWRAFAETGANPVRKLSYRS